MKKLFGTDGIRAVAGQSPLDASTIYAIGLALAHSLGARRRVAPCLARHGYARIRRVDCCDAHGGTYAGGASVENAGVITTPAIAFLTRTHGFAAGIVISASHNPWQDNGIKVFGSDGYKLPDAIELAIEDEIFRRLAEGARRRWSRLLRRR